MLSRLYLFCTVGIVGPDKTVILKTSITFRLLLSVLIFSFHTSKAIEQSEVHCI